MSWAALAAIIRAQPDSVRAVMQTHDRKVTATFLDGHRIRTTEPAIDAIVTLLRQVDPAGHVLIATE
jgi:prepilin-type processing-associated H-X9-DG protein